jgi:hypothetical protein
LSLGFLRNAATWSKQRVLRPKQQDEFSSMAGVPSMLKSITADKPRRSVFVTLSNCDTGGFFVLNNGVTVPICRHPL